MDDLDRYIAMACERSPEFKLAYEAEKLLLERVRARQMAKLMRNDFGDQTKQQKSSGS